MWRMASARLARAGKPVTRHAVRQGKVSPITGRRPNPSQVHPSSVSSLHLCHAFLPQGNHISLGSLVKEGRDWPCRTWSFLKPTCRLPRHQGSLVLPGEPQCLPTICRTSLLERGACRCPAVCVLSACSGYHPAISFLSLYHLSLLQGQGPHLPRSLLCP